jgi:hypothetical protein
LPPFKDTMAALQQQYGHGEVTQRKALPGPRLRQVLSNPKTTARAVWFNLIFATLLHGMLRSAAGNDIIWVGNSQTLQWSKNTDISWHEDSTGRWWTHLRIRKDKTQAKSKITWRFIPDGIIPGVNFSDITRSYIRDQRLPSGYRLFSPKGSDGEFVNTTFNNWSTFRDDFCQFLHIDPSEYGSHTCRRSMSEYLMSCGLSEEDLRYLGYWRSIAVREYTGPEQVKAMRLFNLAIQRASTNFELISWTF